MSRESKARTCTNSCFAASCLRDNTLKKKKEKNVSNWKKLDKDVSVAESEIRPTQRQTSCSWYWLSITIEGVKGNGRANRLAGKATITYVSEGLKCWGAWDTTYGQKSQENKGAKSQGHHTIDRMEERGVGKKGSMIFLERTREGHRQSDEHWNCFKGHIGEISYRRSGEHNNWFLSP